MSSYTFVAPDGFQHLGARGFVALKDNIALIDGRNADDESVVLKFSRGDNDEWRYVADYGIKFMESSSPFFIGGGQILIVQNGQNPDGSSNTETARIVTVGVDDNTEEPSVVVEFDEPGFDIFAASFDGETLALAVLPNSDVSTGAGLVYLYRQIDSGSTSVWQREAVIRPSQNSGAERFGYSVFVDGNSLAVGALSFDFQFESMNDGIAGSIAQYERDPSGIWVEIGRHTYDSENFDDVAGFNVSLLDGYAVSSVVRGLLSADSETYFDLWSFSPKLCTGESSPDEPTETLACFCQPGFESLNEVECAVSERARRWFSISF